MNVDEMELAIYSKIDALQVEIKEQQAEIKERQTAIKELLTKLPYGYIIVRTFVKDYKSDARSYSKGFTQYYNYFRSCITYPWIKNKEKAYVFKSLQDAEHMAKMIPNHIPNYVEIKIERVESER